MSNIKEVEKDEINLNEIWSIINNGKKIILVISLLFTFIGLILSLTKPKIYELKAVLEIGSIKEYNNVNSKNSFLEHPNNLKQRLEIVYRNRNIASVSIINGTLNLIEIVVHSESNKKGLKELNIIISEVIKEHKIIVDKYKSSFNNENNFLTEQKKLLSKNQEELLVELEKKEKEFINLLKSNSPFSVISNILISSKKEFISKLNSNIYDISEKINKNMFFISDIYIRDTKLVGHLLKNNYPIKPNKKKIIIVAFVFGLILSLFLVFFIEFISKKTLRIKSEKK